VTTSGFRYHADRESGLVAPADLLVSLVICEVVTILTIESVMVSGKWPRLECAQSVNNGIRRSRQSGAISSVSILVIEDGLIAPARRAKIAQAVELIHPKRDDCR